ncbi:Glucose-6-phosphate dehydrogenase, putative [Eimeria praecox]|uniref:glucose-6-phosphate dehydrogenase (NADP(+)) n=1 Tax=Eimeria praecox TaxID=51316 RepID=U6GAE9_9EIME|nr:Glucose-6-phosphate dehydrogenase, putative [Eimeria praecox]
MSKNPNNDFFLQSGNPEGGGVPFLPSAIASPSERRLRVAHPVAVSVACQSSEDFEAQSLDLVLRSLRTFQDANPFKQLVVGLSGGSTPGPLYAALRQTAIAHAERDKGQNSPASGQHSSGASSHLAIDFSRVSFFLVDERYVPPTHPKSNVRLVMEELFGQEVWSDQEAGGAMSFRPTAYSWPHPDFDFSFPDTSLPLEQCIKKYRESLSNLLWRHGGVDLLLLGMGDDGHIASIFPPLSTTQYEAATCPSTIVVHSTTDRFDVHDRISVTLQLLAGASRKVFLIKGESKLDTWFRMESSPEQSPLMFPAIEVINSGGSYVVSFPSIDDFSRRRRNANRLQLRTQSTLSMREMHHLSVIVFGASGDLAKRKTYPALFSLFCEGLLPPNVHIVGFARSKLELGEFWRQIAEHLTYGIVHLLLTSGDGYDDEVALKKLSHHLDTLEGLEGKNNRLFYLALPPQLFALNVRSIRKHCWALKGWNRVVVEKPFGRDSESSEKLSNELMEVLQEKEIYRIDHYLGKEMTLSIIALRFANVAFKHLFHRHNVRCVRITFKEDIGTKGRGGYFNSYGIIRDVMQNHMLQLLTLIAMEPPASLSDEDVRDEKVKVLKQMPPIKMEETILGQYTASLDGTQPGYLDAGKALEKRCTEIRIQLRPIAQSFYPEEDLSENELVIIVQPREAIYLKFYTKKPGLASGLQLTELDLSVMDRLQVDRLPDAYERLLLDVIKGDRQNFVRTDELREAWRIFTPLLRQIDEPGVKPEPYPYGSHGPESAYSFIQRFYSYHKEARYQWHAKH